MTLESMASFELVFAALVGLLVAYVAWTFVCLELNVRDARRIGIAYVRLPVDSNNVLWTIFQPLVWNILDRLPFAWTSYPYFVRYSRRGWHFSDKSDTHVRLGPVWALVTPVAVYLHIADADAIHDIFLRRADFVRPIKEYSILEVYGPCISTAGWDDWPRHRKVLAAPFNEAIMEFVWDESLRQATGMLRSWLLAGVEGIPSMQRDTRTLSLNVLAATAFRKSYEFRGSVDGLTDESGSYRDSLQTVLDSIIPLMLIPHRLLRGPLVPKSWARIGNAAATFQQHMTDMLREEMNARNEGKPGSGGIMSAFVHALDTRSRDIKNPDAKSDSMKKGLAEEEIYGNLFVINFAGHDTTANTLAFSMLLLAANPQIQDWIAEEISRITGDRAPELWKYKEFFPALKRCRAILLETLRLFPPVMALPKWTSRRAQTLKVAGKTLTIPPGVNTTLYIRAVQSHPDYWPEPDEWKPDRWILQAAAETAKAHTSPMEEELLVPKLDTYFPWSDGPQNCPGKKFSEVEAVAVLACLFGRHRLRVKRLVGESEGAAQQRALSCTQDVNMEMLLRMANADQVPLICTPV
ncbi:cytochrome P450 [Xylariomycetidae sp. FL2044]|nr:cytochrome P450 [Xylariomycetidae sp. FL2044]